MRKRNPKSSNVDSFKCSILISLHYYDISFHPERISKLKQYECLYDFNDMTPRKFEINNPNISLNIFNNDGEQLCTSSNDGIFKTGNINAAIKLSKNKHTKCQSYFLVQN